MSAKNDSTIKDKIAKLDTLVAWFDSDEFELEQAIERFAEAEKLAKEIEKDLNDFKNKIIVLKKDFSKT